MMIITITSTPWVMKRVEKGLREIVSEIDFLVVPDRGEIRTDL